MPMTEPDWLFPFFSMGVGDSFFIPTLKPEEMTFKIQNSAKKAKVKVRVKPVLEGEYMGVRTWRIE